MLQYGTCFQKSLCFFLFSENKIVPVDLRKDAVYLEKTLDWDGDGADGM